MNEITACEVWQPEPGDCLVCEINELDRQLNESKYKTLLTAVQLGEKLIQAKESLTHGEFKAWIEANCTVKPRQAQKYMRLASHWPELSNAYPGTLLELSINETLRLIAKPKDEGLTLEESMALVEYWLNSAKMLSKTFYEQSIDEIPISVVEENRLAHDNLTKATCELSELTKAGDYALSELVSLVNLATEVCGFAMVDMAQAQRKIGKLTMLGLTI